MATTQETISFTSGTVSSRIPRYDLIPRAALKRVADRFELGFVKDKERSWNARAANQQGVEDKEFLMDAKLERLKSNDDDDAAAIALACICLCEGTEMRSQGGKAHGT